MKTKLNSFKYFLCIFFISLKLFATDEIEPYDKMKFFTLENGMKVYMLSSNKLTNTKISVEVNVGMNIENNENAGITHLLEHLILRDQRVPQNKYVYYLHQAGATYVNGFTGEYLTEYLATIESKKSYWLVETFSNMIFNKKLNEKDLEIEKNALQTEIGDLKWYHIPLNYIYAFVHWASAIFPSTVDIYYGAFSLKKVNSLPIDFYFIQNNKKFTLKQLMSHYDKYYYPSNMILKIAGNFNEQKMKEVIYSSFGTVMKMGTTSYQKYYTQLY